MSRLVSGRYIFIRVVWTIICQKFSRIVFFLVFPVFLTQAQPLSNLYGLSAGNPHTGWYFSKFDPFTGSVTRISTVPVTDVVTGAGSAIDPRQHIYYFIANDSFIGISIDNGKVISKPGIKYSRGIYFDHFIYNYRDSVIYGLERNPSSCFFSKIDPATGVITNISNYSLTKILTYDNAVVDPFEQIFYFSTDSNFLGVEIATGRIVSNTKINQSNCRHFMEPYFDCKQQSVCGLARNYPPSETYLAKLDVLNGNITCISKTSVCNTSIAMTFAMYNPGNRFYYIVGENKIVMVGMDDGEVHQSTAWSEKTRLLYFLPAEGIDCFGLESDLIMPNVFTPNSDGINDLFVPIRYSGIEKAKLDIYNRWGEKIFTSDDVKSGWDGNSDNFAMQDGTYFWLVTYTSTNGSLRYLSGTVTVIR